MSFETSVIAFCDRFVSQRTFDLIIDPALADLQYEEEAGRRGRFQSRVPVLRAVAGGVLHDLQRGSGGFLKLTLLSACYYLFPLALTIRMFETWSDVFEAAVVVLVLSLTPVVVCFWPSRDPVRPGE
jgi:hypothetical protein